MCYVDAEFGVVFVSLRGELNQYKSFACIHITLGQILINIACLGFSLPSSKNSDYTWGRSEENSSPLVEVSCTCRTDSDLYQCSCSNVQNFCLFKLLKCQL